MMRSLWTAASGMKTQQMTVDTISNNLANVDTSGYKKERMEFKSLLYENMEKAGSTDSGSQPINLEIGHGVRAAGTSRSFTQGSIERTELPMDIAIEGNGMFGIQTSSGDIRYTRDGSFKLALSDDGSLSMTTVEGYKVVDMNGDPIELDAGMVADNIEIDEMGNIFYQEGTDDPEDLGIQLGVFQFQNPQGLSASGDDLLTVTAASGEAMAEADNEDLPQSTVVQGALEGSNVQAVEEMVNLIVAQRAYELSSKAIETSDDMLSLANNLKS